MNKTLKSILAVVAGFIAVFILSVATDYILESLHIFPPISGGLFVTWMLVLALLYRNIYAIIGGYITASLAPTKPMKHTIVLAILGFTGALIGLITTWGKGLGPEWYPILLVVLAIPSVWLGGKLRIK